MDLFNHLVKARQAASSRAEARRTTQIFKLDWRSTGWEFVVGFTTLCAKLGVKENTVRSRLSTSKNSWKLKRINPVFGEYDQLTVSAIPLAKVPKGVRGRVAKQVDWDRLGSEAPGYVDTGTTLAPPAKIVPKTRKRRTRDKR